MSVGAFGGGTTTPENGNILARADRWTRVEPEGCPRPSVPATPAATARSENEVSIVESIPESAKGRP